MVNKSIGAIYEHNTQVSITVFLNRRVAAHLIPSLIFVAKLRNLVKPVCISQLLVKVSLFLGFNSDAMCATN